MDRAGLRNHAYRSRMRGVSTSATKSAWTIRRSCSDCIACWDGPDLDATPVGSCSCRINNAAGNQQTLPYNIPCHLIGTFGLVWRARKTDGHVRVIAGSASFDVPEFRELVLSLDQDENEYVAVVRDGRMASSLTFRRTWSTRCIRQMARSFYTRVLHSGADSREDYAPL